MYTLNLKDIKLTPAITEDKEFKGESRTDVSNEAVEYINATFKDVYNPVTVSRLADAAIKDEKGETMRQQSRRENEELHEKTMGQYNTDRAAENASFDTFKANLASIGDQEDAQVNAIRTEYKAKIASAATDDEKDNLEDERDLKIDGVRHEFDKKRDAAQGTVMSGVSDRNTENRKKLDAEFPEVKDEPEVSA